jgi:hypothetical protein
MQDIASASQLTLQTPYSVFSHLDCGTLSKQLARSSRTMGISSTPSLAKQLVGGLVLRKRPHTRPRLIMLTEQYSVVCYSLV